MAGRLPLGFPVVALLVASSFISGCMLRSTARRWHDRRDPQGRVVYYTTVTKIGLNLAVFVPAIGDMSIDGLVNDLTERVSEEKGDGLRVVQGNSENYWYGWPPFTWVLTPVISTLAAEYRPSDATLLADLEGEKSTNGSRGTRRWWKPWSW